MRHLILAASAALLHVWMPASAHEEFAAVRLQEERHVLHCADQQLVLNWAYGRDSGNDVAQLQSFDITIGGSPFPGLHDTPSVVADIAALTDRHGYVPVQVLSACMFGRPAGFNLAFRHIKTQAEVWVVSVAAERNTHIFQATTGSGPTMSLRDMIEQLDRAAAARRPGGAAPPPPPQ